ncbi:MAG: hypothetical protein ACO3A4_04780 [Silvanigrellaceae bacterium]
MNSRNYVSCVGLGCFLAVVGCSDSSRFSAVTDQLLQRPVAANGTVDNVGKSSVGSAAAQGEKTGSNSADSDSGAGSASTQSDASSRSTPVGGEVVSNPSGLSGGHFDLDTSTRMYPFYEGQVDNHTHAFDDAYNVTGVDFFNIQEQKHVEIDEAVTEPGKRFVLLVVNSNLSPGAVLNINGVNLTAVQYAADLAALLKKGASFPVYTLGKPMVAGDIQLTKFSINFPINAITNGGLVPLASGDVRKNKPGTSGEYRTGALTIQAVEVDALSMDARTGAATADSRMLWETNVYWHRD